jgi:hypothetical protein
MTEEAIAPVPKSRPRPHRINVRYSQKEYRHVIEQARIANLKPATLLRELSLGSCLTAVPRFPKDVYRAIRSMGGNINQLARQANSGHGNPKQVEALRASVNDLLKVLLH